jgi:hypothetical protein
VPKYPYTASFVFYMIRNPHRAVALFCALRAHWRYLRAIKCEAAIRGRIKRRLWNDPERYRSN